MFSPLWSNTSSSYGRWKPIHEQMSSFRVWSQPLQILSSVVLSMPCLLLCVRFPSVSLLCYCLILQFCVDPCCFCCSRAVLCVTLHWTPLPLVQLLTRLSNHLCEHWKTKPYIYIYIYKQQKHLQKHTLYIPHNSRSTAL